MGAQACRVFVVGLLFAAYALPAQAQYFGRNKVRYHQANVQILHTAHFDIYFHKESLESAQRASVLAERWYDRLSKVLRHELSSRQPLILYPSHAAFEQTNVVGGLLGESIGGVTEGMQRRIILPFDAGLGETNHVIGHEIVHAFQYDMAERAKRQLSGLPLWFIEGMAEYLSVGADDPYSTMLLHDAARHERLPSIGDLGGSRISPYRAGQALFAWLTSVYGEQVVEQIFSAKAKSAVNRIELVTGVSESELTKRWHASITGAMPERDGAEEAGRLVVSRTNGGRINVAPALSPDGRHLVFLSERDRLSIDVFLANAETGAIERKILTTAEDPHIESLGFLRSSGTWSPDGQRILLALVRNGRPVLAIYNVADGSHDRDVVIGGVDQIFQPSWSPDGRLVAFSALRAGVTDLYLFDLVDSELRQLTNDAYSDLQPSWSPDGRRLAFCSDRSSTSLDGLSFGAYQLAILEVGNGAVTPLPDIDGGAIDPQWTHDGSGLFFRAGLTGEPDVFRIDIESGQIARVTSVESGVTGLTSFSPSLSSARQSGRLAFSTLDDSGFEIRILDAAGEPQNAPGPLPFQVASSLPTLDAAMSAALPSAADATATPTPYNSKLSLTNIGRPSFMMGTGGGGSGTFVRGGSSILFSDVLGDRRFGVAAQAGMRLEDLIVQAQYLNQTTRWTWGARVELLPYLDGARQRLIEGTGSARVFVDSVERVRQMHTITTGFLSYPFSRSLRVELNGGYHAAFYHRAMRSRTFSMADGTLIADTTDDDAPSHRPLSLFETGAALVHDTTVFGAVSPLLGQRYRFELTSSVGDTSFVTALGDYRHYWMLPLRPFTVAARFVHIGRYGRGADDSRLVPLSLRRQALVRGTEGAIVQQACRTPSGSQCVELADATEGSRMMAAQIELRFPLLGMFSRRLNWGRFPLEGFAFADAGSTWWPGEAPVWFGGHRSAPRSAGSGLRVNLGGFILEVAGARRFDSERRGWRFVFSARPPF